MLARIPPLPSGEGWGEGIEINHRENPLTLRATQGEIQGEGISNMACRGSFALREKRFQRKGARTQRSTRLHLDRERDERCFGDLTEQRSDPLPQGDDYMDVVGWPCREHTAQGQGQGEGILTVTDFDPLVDIGRAARATGRCRAAQTAATAALWRDSTQRAFCDASPTNTA
jgi:hypothetical protein